MLREIYSGSLFSRCTSAPLLKSFRSNPSDVCTFSVEYSLLLLWTQVCTTNKHVCLICTFSVRYSLLLLSKLIWTSQSCHMQFYFWFKNDFVSSAAHFRLITRQQKNISEVTESCLSTWRFDHKRERKGDKNLPALKDFQTKHWHCLKRFQEGQKSQAYQLTSAVNLWSSWTKGRLNADWIPIHKSQRVHGW